MQRSACAFLLATASRRRGCGSTNTGLFTRDAAPNTGLRAHTGDAADEGKFRAPTLRNIARTAPYMHDGGIATLREVIDHYASGGRAAHVNRSPLLRPLALMAAEREDLLAFLDSLTDIDALVDSRWGDRWLTRYDHAASGDPSSPHKAGALRPAEGLAYVH